MSSPEIVVCISVFLHPSHRRVGFCILSVLFWSCYWAHHWCVVYWWRIAPPPASFNNLADFPLLFQHANESSSTRMCSGGNRSGCWWRAALEEQLSLKALQTVAEDGHHKTFTIIPYLLDDRGQEINCKASHCSKYICNIQLRFKELGANIRAKQLFNIINMIHYATSDDKSEIMISCSSTGNRAGGL